MEIKKLEPSEYALWDAFCAKNSDAWFWHTTRYLKYQQAYRPNARTLVHYFYGWRDGEIVAICPLALEHQTIDNKDTLVFSLGEDFLPAPVISDGLPASDRERISKTLFGEIDRLAKELHVSKASFEENPLTPRFLSPTVAPANTTLAFGYCDASLRTQIIDPQWPDAQQWAAVRQGYKSLIHRAEEAFQFQWIDQQTITPDNFRAYQELHRKAAGRVTRPQSTFDTMREWIEKGHGALAQALKGGQVVAAALMVLYKNRAYYKSGCNDPDLESDWALGHFVQWKSIQEMKKRGITHYEIGLQFNRPSLVYNPSDKEMQIAFFKRGFGGYTIPWLRGEKYYSPELFESEFKRRVAEASASVKLSAC